LKSTRPDPGNRCCAVLLGLSAALWASPGWGQTPATDASAPADTSPWSSASLVTSDFTLELQVPNGDSWIRLSTRDAANYLNQARCQCASPVRVLVQMVSNSRVKLAGVTTTGTNARLYVGTNCAINPHPGGISTATTLSWIIIKGLHHNPGIGLPPRRGIALQRLDHRDHRLGHRWLRQDLGWSSTPPRAPSLHREGDA
jgi:hypothetical protein